jgi:hypothetical protein
MWKWGHWVKSKLPYRELSRSINVCIQFMWQKGSTFLAIVTPSLINLLYMYHIFKCVSHMWKLCICKQINMSKYASLCQLLYTFFSLSTTWYLPSVQYHCAMMSFTISFHLNVNQKIIS